MSLYPSEVQTYREKVNLPGVTFDTTDKATLFVEDLTVLEDEVSAIETTLGVNPQGTFESVAARLDAAGGVSSFNGSTGDVSAEGANIGAGVPVYNGSTSDGGATILEFKTLTSSDSSVMITDRGTDVDITAGTSTGFIEIPFLIHENTGAKTNTNYEDLWQPCVIDLSGYSNVISVVFRADMTSSDPTPPTMYAQLRNLTAGVVIAESEVSATPEQYEHAVVSSEDLAAIIGNTPQSLSVRVKVSGGTAYFYGLSILIRCGV